MANTRTPSPRTLKIRAYAKVERIKEKLDKVEATYQRATRIYQDKCLALGKELEAANAELAEFNGEATAEAPSDG